MNRISLLFKPKSWFLWVLFAATIMTGGVIYIGLSQSNKFMADAPETLPSEPIELPSVAALGRLEPMGEIVEVAAPLVLDGDRLAKLFVQEGDWVEMGDSIAVLNSRDRLQDEVTQAEQQVHVAEAKLAQVQAGAKSGEITAQAATVTQQSAELTGQLRRQQEAIARIEAQYEGDRAAQTATVQRFQAELQTAEAELSRYQTLYEAGAVSASLYDSKQLTADAAQQSYVEAEAILERTEATAQRQLQEARAELTRLETTGQAQLAAEQSTLDQVAEVRVVDVQMAQAELDAAQADLAKAQKNLDRATIRAPKAGQIIAIHTQPGEQISEEGILALGQTDQMLVIAEVYQSDISRVELGQQATMRGQAFLGELRGEVIEIGRQISRQNVFSTEPGENLDRRVVEVKIALIPEDSQRVAGLSNLQVQTVIMVNHEL
ncbi:MAG: HlyD family efflux transporter periplasmic adaptor subunit [Leptolyngbya sp. SIO1D8]|nr:HlyD family efflux transporter periplasmic adaptor subunit [Leptolyngbya sp. SIO1D8]